MTIVGGLMFQTAPAIVPPLYLVSYHLDKNLGLDRPRVVGGDEMLGELLIKLDFIPQITEDIVVALRTEKLHVTTTILTEEQLLEIQKLPVYE